MGTINLITDGQLPAFPDITSAQQAPPMETTPVIKYMDQRLKLYADADNANYQDYVDENESTGDDNPKLVSYWPDSQKPPHYKIECRTYWQLLRNTTFILHPGETLNRSWAVTHGVSTTDTITISAEISVGNDDIGTKLSASFGHSVTVTDEQTVTTQISISPVPEGQICVFAMYQLIDEFRVIDNDGKLLNYAARGDVDFTDDKHYSGAFLSIPKANQIFPSGTIYTLEKHFPIANS